MVTVFLLDADLQLLTKWVWKLLLISSFEVLSLGELRQKAFLFTSSESS